MAETSSAKTRFALLPGHDTFQFSVAMDSGFAAVAAPRNDEPDRRCQDLAVKTTRHRER